MAGPISIATRTFSSHSHKGYAGIIYMIGVKATSGKRRAGGKPELSDEEVKAIIRERLAGKSLRHLSAKHNLDQRVIANWADGVNRKHLLHEVEREMRDA